MAAELEIARLEDRRQGAGQERRSVAAAGGGGGAARYRLALGSRPRRPPRKRARRRAGAGGDCRGPAFVTAAYVGEAELPDGGGEVSIRPLNAGVARSYMSCIGAAICESRSI